jgi:GNAT superfamily N-acetyltransferase
LIPKIDNNEIIGPLPLHESFDRTKFDCGVDALNIYLKNYALQNIRNSSSRTYVALKNDSCIIGYFSLAFGSVEHKASPPRITRGLGHYPVPVLIIARLAVDKDYQKIGLGKALVKHALLKALNAAEIAGLRAVIVHAKDANAKNFYERFGFVPSPLDPFHLFLLIKDIQESLK